MIDPSNYIDHTILKPETTASQIEKTCKEAIEYKFKAVCVAPSYIYETQKHAEILIEQNIKPYTISTVVGFPHGNIGSLAKINTSTAYVNMGVEELDIVTNIGAIKSNDWGTINSEIELVGKMKSYFKDSQKKDIIIKYIVEIGFLNNDELYKISDLLIEHKIDYIKTCTGYGPRDVLLEDIINIKKHVGNKLKIKASGGIKTYDFCKSLIEAGADRIGTSQSVKIMEEYNKIKL